MSVPTGVTIIAICMLLITIGAILAVGAIAWLIISFKNLLSKKIDEAMAKVQPIIDKTQSMANQLCDTTEKLTGAVNNISSKAEETADLVGEKVKNMSEKVEGAVNPQVVTIAGLVGTAARCVQIYQDMAKIRGEAKEAKSSDSE